MLSSWRSFLIRTLRQSQKLRQKPFRPCLELLEDRDTPALITWSGGGDAISWDQPSNWDLNRVPAGTDDVSIPDVGNTSKVSLTTPTTIKSIDCNEPFELNGGTLVITDATTTTQFHAAYSQLTGTLDGQATVVMNGVVTWSGGFMTGAGTTRIETAATASITGDSRFKELIGRRFENAGTTTLSGTAAFYIENQATFANLSGALFDIQSDNDILVFGSAPYTFANAGTLRKSAGAATSRIDSLVHNTGLVEAVAGTLQLNGGGTSTGSYLAGPAGKLLFGAGTHTIALAAGQSISGTGTIGWVDGTTTISGPGSYSVDGTTDITGGVVNFNLPASSQTTTQSNGTLGGTGTYTVTGTLTWSGGFMTGAGTTRIETAATASITGDSRFKELVGRRFENAGTTTLSGTAAFYIENQATFANLSGALFDIQSDNDILVFGSAPYTFANAGTLRKSAGAATSRIDSLVHNTGLVEAVAGTLQLNGGGTSTGSYLAGPSGTLLFGAGTHTIAMAAGQSISGTGTIGWVDGTTTISGPGSYSVDGTTDITDGVVNFNLPATSQTTTQSNGTLGGTGTYTVAGTLNWTGGFMAGVGTTHIPATATATITGNSRFKELVGRRFENAGTTTLSGTVALYIENQATFANLSGALFDIQTDNDILVFGSAPYTFANAGTLRKSAGAATSRIDALVNNTGLVESQAGTLQLNGGGTSTGSYQAGSSGTLLFGAGTHTIALASGQSISGSGTIGWIDGTTTISGPGSYAVAGTTSVTGGVVEFNLPAISQTTTQSGGTLGGTGTYKVAGTLTWTGGFMTGLGTTRIEAAATATITGNSTFKELVGRRFENAGTTTLSGTAALYIESQATLANLSGAVFDIQSDVDILVFGAAPYTINNAGTLRKSAGAATSRLDALMNNSGLVEAAAGTLQLNGGGVSSGSFKTITGTTISFTETHTLTAGASLTGPGLFVFTDNLIWAGGIQSGNGETNIAAGATLTLQGTLTIQGNLTGSGNLEVQGQRVEILGANSTFTGQTRVSSGVLLVNGALPGSIEVRTGGTLGGGGAVGAVVVKEGGVFNPGNSPGILTVQNGIRFESDAVNALDLVHSDVDAFIPGQSYDQTTIENGRLDLTAQPELRINVVGNIQLFRNNSLVLFDNRTSLPNLGNFRNLPEGSLVSLDTLGTLFQITYKGGDGNDVVCTQVSLVSQVTIAASTTNVAADKSLTLTAAVQSVAPNLPRVPRGLVILKDGAVGSGQAQLQSGQTQFVFSGGSLALGSHVFQVAYQGDSNFQQSTSSSVTVVVQPAGTGGEQFGQLALSNNSFVVSEKDGALVITIVRSGGSDREVAVDVTLASPLTLLKKQQATAGVDFTSGLGSANFTGTIAGRVFLEAGVKSKTVSIAIANDQLVEENETFNIALSNPHGGATLGSPAGASAQILDDDLPEVANRQVPGALLNLAAEGFGKSEEHYRDFVQKAYAQFLGRNPDETGLQYWVGLMRLYETSKHTQGLRQQQIEAGFLDSQEYKRRYGGIGEAWIRGIYKDLLGREADGSGLQFWLGVLSAGVQPTEVALGFTSSEERLRNRVNDSYRTFLDRAADSQGLEYWVALFKAGFTTEDINSGFVGSPEYYAKANRGGGNPAQWVRSAYLDVLFRPAAVSEFGYWLQVLNG